MTEGPLRLLASPPGAGAYLAVDKPAGRAVHGPHGLLAEAREAWGADLHLVHRLDRITSGVLLLARGDEALREAHAAWPSRVTKTYLALTRGVPDPPEGVVDAPLPERRSGRPELLARALRAAYGPARAGHLLSGRRVGAIPELPAPGRTAVHPAGRPAVTAYRVVAAREGCALVELVPATGRMHQLRVHLLHLGTPVLGDPLYDPARREADPPPFLHALRLAWRRGEEDASEGAWVWEAPASPPAGFGG